MQVNARMFRTAAGMAAFIAATFLQTSVCSAQAQWTRDDVAAALAEAEARRLSISITICERYEYVAADTPSGKKELETFRLSDAQGRYRFQQTRTVEAPDGRKGKNEEVVTWDGNELRSQLRFPDKPEAANRMAIKAEKPTYHMYDDHIWPLLGAYIDYPISDRTPQTRISEAVADPDAPVQISEVKENGITLVKVELLDPFLTDGRGPEFIYKFDPARDWMMVECMKNTPGRKSDGFATRYSKQFKIVESKQIGNEWIPMKAEVDQVMRSHEEEQVEPLENQAGIGPLVEHDGKGIVREIFLSTIEVLNVDVEPELADDDFTINVADLPENSSIVDSRLGISYKLGQDLIYKDGQLHKLGEPILDEIEPEELDEVMADSVPLSDAEPSSPGA